MAKFRDKQARSYAENKLIRDYFGNKNSGCFVEVGANDPTDHGSQTWHLENELNWHGVLVEPIPELAKKCRETRPNAEVFECVCVEPNAPKSMKLYIPYAQNDDEELLARSAIGINIDDGNFQRHKEIVVQARTLNSILQEAEINAIDLLSIDVEGAELEVITGTDLEKYNPNLILLEDKHLYLTKHRLLKKKGYRFG